MDLITYILIVNGIAFLPHPNSRECTCNSPNNLSLDCKVEYLYDNLKWPVVMLTDADGDFAKDRTKIVCKVK